MKAEVNSLFITSSRLIHFHRNMNNLEATHNCVVQRLVLVEDLVWLVVAGDDELLGADVDRIPFGFGNEGILVCPDLEMMPQLLAVEVVQNHVIFLLIATPPLVLHLHIGARIVLPGVVALAHAWRAVDPHTAAAVQVLGRFHVVLGDVLQRPIVFDVYIRRAVVQFAGLGEVSG